MLDIFLDKLKKILNNRIVPILVIFFAGFAVIVMRLYRLQILATDEEVETDTETTVITRDIKSTRGNFYDRNGVQLTKNVVTYSVLISNTALVSTNDEKNAMLLKLIKLLKAHGYDIELDFCIDLNDDGSLSFNVTDNALLRFKKNAYCLAYVSQLSAAQRDATAAEVFNFLRYGDSSSSMFDISDDYTMEEAYEIMVVRYNLLIQNPQYSQITLASDIDEETVAAVKESIADIPGVEVSQTTSREYINSLYFAHMLGYTGLITTTELADLDSSKEVYSANDIIGKTGLEKSMEKYLAGEKGEENVTIDSSGKIVSTQITKEPVAGNDVYLTVDSDLQICVYNILERNVASILLSKINNGYDYGTKGTKASGIMIPIYEVYNALIGNNVIDITQFTDSDASELEKEVYSSFKVKNDEVMAELQEYLAEDNTVTNAAAGSEMEDYLDYSYSQLISTGVINSEKIDKTDEEYVKYSDGLISLSRFIEEAISKDWVDMDVLGISDEFLSTDEIYSDCISYLMDYFTKDKGFEKKVYRTLIFNGTISGSKLCLLLFDQGVLEYNEADVNALTAGTESSYNFLIEKITNLEITPAQLALEPCSASCVISDVNNGSVLAMVSYPSYDNNYLANKIDYDYYEKLLEDGSYPLIDRPTQQRTATGSTFKLCMSFAGFGEGVIDPYTTITDKGVFEEIVPSPKCWKYPGTHGTINVTQAIQHSCNYFFFQVGYWLSLNSRGIYDDALGIGKIKKYATMFGLNDKSGVEVEESQPEISDTDAVRTSIGYYHNFAPVQISRYAATVANSGTCYNYTLLDKVMSQDGTEVYEQKPSVLNKITQYSSAEWNAVHQGMWDVVNTSADSLNTLYSDLGVVVAGKTGTAQVSLTHPHHALFVSYAPFDDPDISVTVVIPNGYTSANAAYVAREIYGLYYNDENKEELLSGDIKAGNATSITISD